MLCKKCGKTIDDNSKSCPYCGLKTEGPGDYEYTEPAENEETVNPGNTGRPEAEANGKKKGKKKKRIIPVAAAAVLVLFFLSTCGGSPEPPDDAQTTAPAEAAEQPEEPEETEDSQTVSQEAVEELVGYIDQAEERISKAVSDVEAINKSEESGEEQNISSADRFRERAGILEVLLADLSGLKEQADAVSGVDAVLKNAVDEFFTMNQDAMNGHCEIMAFMGDYLDFCTKVIDTRPWPEDAASAYEYYYALDEWCQLAKEEYAAISSCPLCMEEEWKRYGEILDLNDSIVNKTALANNYDDGLRWQSVKNMSERYKISEELQYNVFTNCIKGEKTHVGRQQNISSQLSEEIHAYAEMGEEERSGYEFEYVRTGKIFVGDDAFEAVDTIYPSLYNTYETFLIIKTGCVSGTRKILVEAEIPGFTQKYSETITLDSAYREIRIKPPALTGELNLSSAKDAQLTVSISEMDGTLLVAKKFDVTIKSKYDFDWISDEYGVVTKDNILCFLTPESSAVSEMKRLAIDEISHMTDGQMESFVGYQNTGWNHYKGTYLQAAGIMRALNEMGVRYNMKTFSISNSNQHILLPDDVLEQRGGLCIETSLVVASALQSAGMHAFLVLPPGHAQVAVEVWNGRGEDTSGAGEYLLIETTALADNWESAFIAGADALQDYKGPSSGPITYKNQESWEQYLSVEGTYLIDCDDSRVLGLTPFVN